MGMIELLLESSLGEKEKRNVEQLIHNLDAINSLLDDMITYSRADSGLITLDNSTISKSGSSLKGRR